MSELMENFWDRWISADELKRVLIIEEIVPLLPFYNKQAKDKIKRYSMASLLNSYFTDLEEILNSKNKCK